MMRLQWTQLQAVFFFILVLHDINLVSADNKFDAAKEKLDNELEPFIHPIFGYLPAMPYLTVHSALVSLMEEEYDIKEYSDFNFTDKSPEGFRNTEVAASMAVYLKQTRPFKEDPFGIELTGLLLERIAKEVTSDDLANERLNLGLVLMPAWTLSFVRRCCADGRNFAEKKITSLKNQWLVKRADLVDYIISGWHKIQLQPISMWNTFLEELSTCTEAALRWTVFEAVKNRFESALEKHVFQDVLDDFLAFMDDNQDQAKLLAYTIQLGVHYDLLRATKTGKLQLEFHELLKGSSQVGPQIKKFNHFLAYLGLVSGTFNKEELAFKFEDQDFARIDVDLNVAGWKDFFKGLKPFDLANTTVKSLRWSPFFTIFEGFKQYQLDESFLNQNVFKWRQVMHFIVSYGHMFKKVSLKGFAIEPNKAPATDPPTVPATEPKTVPSKAPSAQTQSKVTRTGCCTRGKACLICGLIGVVAFSFVLAYTYWPRNTQGPVTCNTTTYSSTELFHKFNEHWTTIIIMLVVIVLLTLACCAIWWYYWVYQEDTETSSDEFTGFKVDKKKKRKKKKLTLKATPKNQQLKSPVSLLSTGPSPTTKRLTSPASSGGGLSSGGLLKQTKHHLTASLDSKLSATPTDTLWSSQAVTSQPKTRAKPSSLKTSLFKASKAVSKTPAAKLSHLKLDLPKFPTRSSQF